MGNSKNETGNSAYLCTNSAFLVCGRRKLAHPPCAHLTPWTNVFLHLPSPKDHLFHSQGICADALLWTLWSPAFNSPALLCASFCFCLPPCFTAVQWHLTLPRSMCWKEQVPKPWRLWETERTPWRVGLCLTGPSCPSSLAPGTRQDQRVTLVLSFSHLLNCLFFF